MREHKFRAWNESANRYSKPFSLKCSVLNFTDDDGLGVMKSLTDEFVEQFTGLTDMNGVEIYEGDIWKRDSFMATVEFKHSGWQLIKTESSGCYQYPSFYSNAKLGEIIGNIHQNPELLIA